MTCVPQKIFFALASSESFVISQVLDALVQYPNEGPREERIVPPRLDRGKASCGSVGVGVHVCAKTSLSGHMASLTVCVYVIVIC